VSVFKQALFEKQERNESEAAVSHNSFFQLKLQGEHSQALFQNTRFFFFRRCSRTPASFVLVVVVIILLYVEQ
jgi:hypothetical protein